MVTVVKTPKSVHTVATSRGQNWSNLSSFTLTDSDIARCENITTMTGAKNKPVKVVVDNFNCNLPADATILKLKIIWKDRCVSYSSDFDFSKYPSFGETTFSFVRSF